MTRTVEDALRRAEDQAALLRYAADLAAGSLETPTPAVLSGFADACDNLVETVRAVRQALDVEALAVELRRRRSAPAR
jgi:hypothetical protein